MSHFVSLDYPDINPKKEKENVKIKSLSFMNTDAKIQNETSANQSQQDIMCKIFMTKLDLSQVYNAGLHWKVNQ